MSPVYTDKRKLPAHPVFGTVLTGAAVIAAQSGYASAIASGASSGGLCCGMLSFPGDAAKTKSNSFFPDGTSGSPVSTINLLHPASVSPAEHGAASIGSRCADHKPAAGADIHPSICQCRIHVTEACNIMRIKGKVSL